MWFISFKFIRIQLGRYLFFLLTDIRIGKVQFILDKSPSIIVKEELIGNVEDYDILSSNVNDKYQDIT